MGKLTEHFVRLEPGKWTCVKSAELDGPNGRIQVAIGTTFARGTPFMGVDLADWLEEQYERDQRGT